MTNRAQEDVAKLLIRLVCGCLLFLHGSNTLLTGSLHINDILRSNGLPEFLAYGNYVAEVVAPVFLVLGYKARIAALIIAFNMFMSIVIAHRDIVFARNDYGGWMIELNVFYLVTALVVFFLGSGKYSLAKGQGRWD